MVQALYTRRMEWWVESESGLRWEPEDSCFLGRDKASNIVLEGRQVSRRHALIQRHRDGSCWLLDFGSANGTWLNGRRVISPAQLTDRDRIRIGLHELYFRQKSARAARRAQEPETTQNAAGRHLPVAHGIALADQDGRLRCLTVTAREWLRDYFGATGECGQLLPAALRTWMKQPAGCDRRGGRECLCITGDDGRRLVVDCQPDGDGQRVLLMTEERRAFVREHLRNLGLTAREAEVLHWIAEGKSNPETAVILGIRPRTVDKHVEHILRKLGVESRSAAMFRVLELMPGVAAGI